MRKRIAPLLVLALLFSGAHASEASAATVPAKSKVKCVPVPDVVGKNYQKAQNILRLMGFAVMPAIDASGADRWAWIDKHWFVLAQTPRAGKCVKMGSSVTATILKYTDV